MTIYTAGYSGHRASELKAIADKLGATVIDIRFNPMSRIPEWRHGALAKLFGSCYWHLPSLGNRNYRDPALQIEILDLGIGIEHLYDIEDPLILLCGCKDAARCHRTVIADELRRRGHDVRELDWTTRS